MNTRKGSITAYISLVLLIILSLFLQSLSAVRDSHAREMTACAMQQGIFSLFAQYDKTLLREYELIFIDGGFGTDQYRPDLMQKTISDYAEMSLQSSRQRAISVVNLSGKAACDVNFSSLTLATDHQGAAFCRQAIEAMKANLGSVGAQLLFQQLKGRMPDQKQSTSDSQQAIEEYHKAKEEAKAAEEKRKEAEKNAHKEGITEERKDTVKPPENFRNPIETVSKLMSQGILSLVLPETEKIPAGSVEETELLHNRSKNTGFGSIDSVVERDSVDKTLLCAYALWKFDSFTSRKEYAGLNLQLEYLLEGEKTDVENLTSVLKKLVAIREASNLMYLWSDAGKIEEMAAMSEMIVAALALPIAQPVVMHALAACWAFAESVVEIRSLLEGNKIPFLPTAGTWMLSLEHLADFAGKITIEKQTAGLGYSEFLGTLLMGVDTELITNRMMDLVEQNMRNRFGKPYFHLDYCVDEAEVSMDVHYNRKNYSIIRNYGYKERV